MPKQIAFERATELAASQLAFFLRGNGEERLEPTENERLLAGHIVGNLWANNLLNTEGENWVTVETIDSSSTAPKEKA